MVRIILGVIAGFIAWSIAWFGSEKLLSAIWPAFGAQQSAFQAAIENEVPFAAETTFLLTQIVLATIVSVMSGFLAALVSGENKRAPFILGCVLLTMGLLKMAMSWSLVPIWHHVIFTALLLPMTILGGKLKTTTS